MAGRFVTLPRVLAQQLREAENAIMESRYNDAVVRLGDLLAQASSDSDEDELLSQDFFLDAGESRVVGTPLNKSFKVKIRDMIGGLPSAALETYELRYGPSAGKMLDEAASTRDWTKVREVRRRYFHTQAGYDASWLLAQHEMLEGHPIAASVLLDDVVTVPRAVNRLGNGVVVLHAAACKLAKRTLPAALVGVSGPSGKISVGGVERSGPEDGALSEWLGQFYGSAGKLDAGQLEDYLVFNASKNRNGATSGQIPLSNVRWQLGVTVSAKQEREVNVLSNDLMSAGELPPPSWMPLRVGETLLMRTTEYLVGVDYRTGKRIWLHPFSNTEEEDEEETNESNVFMRKPNAEAELTGFLRQRVWNDLPYGQVTSDGQRVYMLKGLNNLSSMPFGMMAFPGARRSASSGNSLVALELASEGMIKWFQGAISGPDSPLANAFFLGAPLPIEGRLYTMCELAGDIFLICLEPRTGKEIWRQQLAAVESGTINQDRIRRVSGAMLSYEDGFLICPTGAGAMVAVNLGDRTLRWGVNYQRSLSQSALMVGRGNTNDTKKFMQRWFTGTAIISDLSVLVTPVESDRLLGLNLLTGKPLFTPKVRLEMRYLAGIRGDKFFVVGPKVMKAYALSNGSQAWKAGADVFSSGQHVAGQGVFGKDCYLLPTTTREIIKISLKDGSVMNRRVTNYELGNMVAVDGEIITQGPTTLSVAFGERTLAPLVERMLKEDPDNFDAIVRKSELLIQSGEFSEALQLLKKARQAQPENDEVRMLSVTGMLALFRESKSLEPKSVLELSELIDRPSQRVEFNALRLELALANEDYKQVSSLLMELSGVIVSDFKANEVTTQVLGGGTGQVCLLDAWVNGRVREALARIDPELKQDFEVQLEAYLQGMLAGTSERLERILTHFDGVKVAEQIRSVLDQRYLFAKKTALREQNALGHLQPNQTGLGQLSMDRLIMLASTYASGDMFRNAMDVLREIESRSETLSEQEAELIDGIRDQSKRQLDPREWPKDVEAQWSTMNRSGVQLRVSSASAVGRQASSVNVQAGEQFRGWELLAISQNALALRTPNGVEKPLRFTGRQISEKRKIVSVSGGVMVVQTTNEIFAIDLYHAMAGRVDPILWFRSMVGSGLGATSLETTATPFGDQISSYRLKSDNMKDRPEFRVGPILGDRVIVLQGGELLAIGLHSGLNIWQAKTAPENGMLLCDGERVAVVSSSQKETVMYDVVDGRELERMPFEHGESWRAAGQNLLCYQATEQDDVYVVKVFNPFTGKVLLTQKANSSKNPNRDSEANVFICRIFSGHYLAMMSPEGETCVWDLREAREVIRTQVPALEKLGKLRVILLRDLVVLLPGETPSILDRSKLRVLTRRGESHHTVNSAFAFSIKDGSLVWSKQFEQPWGCTSPQAMDTPALLFARMNMKEGDVGKTQSVLEVLALDVNDGNVLLTPEPKQLPDANSQYLDTKLLVNPAALRIEAKFGRGLLLSLSFLQDGDIVESDQPELGPEAFPVDEER